MISDELRARIVECEQGSEEWKAARVGRVTASRVADIVAKGKSGPSASRANYLAEIVCELLTGESAENTIDTPAMKWGRDQEEHARRLYGFMQGTPVTKVGLVLHPTIDGAAASPDGLVGDDGLVQFKCPQLAAHISLLRMGSIDGRYVKQMQWEMACAGRAWCDFVSFNPKMPPEMQLFRYRVRRDGGVIVELETAVHAFICEARATADHLRKVYAIGEDAA